MKKAIVLCAVLAVLVGCKEEKKEAAKAEVQKTEQVAAASTTAELGPCYKYMHCQADSEINYSGLSKSECSTKGGKSWKSINSGCTEL